MAGVYAILTADDIPGDNQIGNILQDEPLLANGKVHYIGQPIAIVVGKNAEVARVARRKITIEFEELPALFEAREAYHQGQVILPPRTYSLASVGCVPRTID